MSWDESRPQITDQVRDLGLVVRSHKTEFRAGVESHFYWTESSGLSAGEPAIQNASTATGTCRIFYGTESQVSADRPGTFMLTSDTSRLFALDSATTTLVGALQQVRGTGLSVGTTHFLVQVGSFQINVDTSTSTAFDVTYVTTPNIQAVLHFPENGTNEGRVAISALSEGGFTAYVEKIGGAFTQGTVRWRAVGKASL